MEYGLPPRPLRVNGRGKESHEVLGSCLENDQMSQERCWY
jgi:hypothetical protein